MLCLSVREKAARIVGARRIQRFSILVDVRYDALLVDHKSGPVGKTVLGVQDSIFLGNGPVKITEQREGHAYLLGKRLVRRRTVHADAQNLSVCLLEFGEISLIRLEFLRSTTCERQNIKRQDYVFLASKLAQADRLAILVGKCKVRRLISNFQRCGFRGAGCRFGTRVRWFRRSACIRGRALAQERNNQR